VTETASPTIEERLAALEVLAAAPPVIIGSGETLVIKSPDEWTPNQVRDYQESLDFRYEHEDLPFRVIVVHGDPVAVARPKTEPPSFMDDVREETSGNEHAGHVRLTHLPTGVTAEGPTRDHAVARLGQALLTGGHISINSARAALGLRPFDGDFAGRPLDVRDPGPTEAAP
jgi:hypothetical protein